jgi:tryptophan synthase alpha chain
MSSIKHLFEVLAAGGDGAFVAYICAGDPDMSFSVEQIHALVDAGADVIEIGVPFSDPVADGPVIQGAMSRALAAGFTTGQVFEIARSVRGLGIASPLIIMTYFNPVLQFGPEEFCREAARAGVDALLIVDLPLEESEEIDGLASENGLEVIRLVAPSTTDSRLGEIVSRSSGFVYAVSAAGTTGARTNLPSSAGPLVSRIASRTRLPIALGFGISTPLHVRAALSLGASGVVEGSRLISTYSSALPDRPRALEELSRHVLEMKEATVGGLPAARPAQH